MYTYTEEQIAAILTSINDMLNLAREPAQALDAMCDPDYLKGRNRYPIPAIVYSGFIPENQNIPGLTIQKILYGKGRSMPELFNSDVTIQLYSDASEFCRNVEVKNKIDAYGRRFEVLQFSINQDTYRIEKLEQISFDGLTDAERAKVDERRVLFEAGEE